MLLTPHIVRTHELTAEDLAPIFIGTQQNVGLGGPPPLIAPQPAGEPPARRPPRRRARRRRSGESPAAGRAAPPAAAPAGVQPTNPAAAGRDVTVPTSSRRRCRPRRLPPAGTAPPAGDRAAGRRRAAGSRRPATPPRAGAAGAGRTGPGRATAGADHRHAAGHGFRVAGGPYTVPRSINNASRVSTITLTVTYNPAVLRVRTVQDGTFMRQGA